MTPPRKKQRLSLDAVEETKPVESTDEAKPEVAPKEEGEKSEISQRRSLFVRSLPATTTTESLTEIFSSNFPIKHAVAVTDKETKQCKGYGFVTFADAEDCQRAKDEFNGFAVDGKKLRCEIAESRNREQEPGAAPVVTPGQKIKDQRDKERAEYQAPKLIVRNLPWSIKHPDQLAKLFQSYGKIKSAVLPKKKSGLLCGFGFVLMRGKPNAEKALDGVNGKEVDGRTIAVDWAVDKSTWDTIQTSEEQKPSAEDNGADADAVDGENEHIMNEDDIESGSDDDDEENVDEMDIDEEDEEEDKPMSDDNSSTLFVRNLPFSCSDEDLEDHFTQFGTVRYARIVLDYETQRPRGTGFVCFYNIEDADNCLKVAPRHQPPRLNDPKTKDGAIQITHSVLQNEDADPSGKFTLEGRVLQVSRAVNKSEANRLTEEGAANRFKRDTDKRRLYLLAEGTIASNSPLYEELAPSERTMRESSAKQRKTLIESNPSLSLSLTRLSIRNIPRTITSKDLKQLAREAVVGFATDVKEGKRKHLSKEELSRGGEEMKQAEAERRRRAKGLVKQATIVFEGREGSKVSEKTGAGRSRGYGFIEYHTHRSALMGLRWLNGHAIGYQAQEKEGKGKKMSKEVLADRKKRLIVEFAIENAQVVQRRKEREEKSRAFAGPKQTDGATDGPADRRDGKGGKFDRRDDKGGKFDRRDGKGGKFDRRDDKGGKFDRRDGKGGKFDRRDGKDGKFDRRGGDDGKFDRKRKRDGKNEADEAKEEKAPADEKVANRSRIIAKKRMVRRARKSGAKA